jgi:hypothetical protein
MKQEARKTHIRLKELCGLHNSESE